MSLLAIQIDKWFRFMPLKYKMVTDHYINDILNLTHSSPIIINNIILVNTYFSKIFEPIVNDIIKCNEKEVESKLLNLGCILMNFEKQASNKKDILWDEEMLLSLGIIYYYIQK